MGEYHRRKYCHAANAGLGGQGAQCSSRFPSLLQHLGRWEAAGHSQRCTHFQSVPTAFIHAIAAKAADEADQQQEKVGFAGDAVSMRLQQAYPLAAIVGMDLIKEALLLGAVRILCRVFPLLMSLLRSFYSHSWFCHLVCSVNKDLLRHRPGET